jgi:hypothetical protein
MHERVAHFCDFFLGFRNTHIVPKALAGADNKFTSIY